MFLWPFIPNYFLLEKPLQTQIHGHSLSALDSIQWTQEADLAFLEMKQTLQSLPTLGLPDPSKTFVQTVDERSECMTSVLLQHHGDCLCPVAYFSAKLDPVAASLPRCIQALAGSERPRSFP